MKHFIYICSAKLPGDWEATTTGSTRPVKLYFPTTPSTQDAVMGGKVFNPCETFLLHL